MITSSATQSRQIKIAVCLNGETLFDTRAHALAAELGLPLTADPGDQYDLAFSYDAQGLALKDRRARQRPMRVDFARQLGTRPGTGLTRRDPLGRAVGRTVRTLVDATAGLCADAVRFACFGLSVLAIERVAVIYALSRDALERASDTPRIGDRISRLRLTFGDANDLLPTLESAPDAIYIDPMFPPKRRRSAATRKELVLLRELAGADMDAEGLLARARDIAMERVIVKRPDDQPPLAPEPTVSYGGKLVRYDVYRTDLR